MKKKILFKQNRCLDLKGFAKFHLQNIYIEIFLHGNISKSGELFYITLIRAENVISLD